jgi:eukaryotic-like serine/threonine-protein kinase
MDNCAENDQHVMAIVSMALRQPASERESYVRLACEKEPALYRETLEAMNWEVRMGSFLQHPAISLQRCFRPFEVGQVISERFEILREIGEGGMGIVYDSYDRKRRQRIAIKSAKPGFQRLLTPELEGALKVRHPNICLVNEIHSAPTSHGELDFLTMELLEGETLSARLKREEKLPSNEVLEIGCQLCAGLSEAHRSGVLHRDLKSANIFLCPAENSLRAVITDFGLACGITQSGERGGTPRYMAPELWFGKEASKASDIYALGVILYEMVAGRPPFEDGSDFKAPPPPPRASAAGLGPQWDRIILACLKPDPSDRPADAALVFAALRKKPLPKTLFLVFALMILAIFSVPQGRTWLRELIWPPPHVRLAVLPSEGPVNVAARADGVLQDVSERIGHWRSSGGSIAVIPPSSARSTHIETPEQAGRALHATHALKTTIQLEGDEYVVQGSLISLETGVHLRDFTGRYSGNTIGVLTEALAGEVSVALRLNGSSPETLSPAATAQYDQALYLLKIGSENSEAAIPLLKEAAHKDPRSPLPLAALVEAEVHEYQANRDINHIDRARQYLDAAQSLNPDSVKVHLAAGLCNETTSHYEQALDEYRRVQELEPRNVDAQLRIARIYDKLDIPEKSVEAYQTAIAMDPAYYLGYENMGEFYYYRGKYQQAAEQFQKTIARAPGMYDAYTNLAAALDNLGNDTEAEQALLISLKFRETARALNSMGAIRAFQKRDREAVAYYKRAVVLEPGEYLYWLNLGDSNRRLGLQQETRVAFRKAMDLAMMALKENPRSGYTRAFVGYFAAMLGDRKRAEQEIGQALQLSPGNNEVIRCAVLTYETLGERDRAFAALRSGTSELLHELDRQPDLAGFRQDSRFQQIETEIDQRR